MTFRIRAIVAGIGLVLAVHIPAPSHADNAEFERSRQVVIYFTRHAEKKTELTELAELKDPPGRTFMEICGSSSSSCAEVLNAKGALRAELLADWFAARGITGRLTHAFSSHKQRTRQTIEMIAADAGLENDVDLIADGVQQFPSAGTELDPESTSLSEAPTIDALLHLPAGSVALVAGHSGTLYDIMAGLGVDTADEEDFPRDENGKVRDYGDLWKVVRTRRGARLVYRKNLQPNRLRIVH